MALGQLAISGVGMITSIGHDAKTTAASLRSDVTRMQEIRQPTRQGYPLVGAPIEGCGEGFIYEARLWDLAAIAASEALRQAESVGDKLLRKRCCVLWLLPEGKRPGFSAKIRDDYRRKFFESSGLASREVFWREFAIGHAAAMAALSEASKILSSDQADACLIGGADTLIQLRVLRWLEANDRLKTETYTDGLIPGEAAAFLIIEARKEVKKRGGPILAWIKGYGFAKEEATILSTKPCRGQGLTKALRAALESADIGIEDVESILCDLNGESYRAQEWGLAAVRLAFSDTVRLVHPADCIGDVGAVTGLLLLGHAAMVVAKPRVAGKTILTFACSESGERGAAVLIPPEEDVHPQSLLVQAIEGNRSQKLGSPKMDFLKNILEDHFEEAVFLWHQWQLSFDSPTYNVREIASLEERLEAHLDGLRIAGIDGWESWKHFLAWKEPGEVFVAGVLALEVGSDERTHEVFEASTTSPLLSRGIVSALGWVSYEQAKPHIQNFLSSSSAAIRIGIAASAIHRRDPGPPLRDAMFSNDPFLRSRALRAVGELGRTELLPKLQSGFADPDQNVRFAAALSATLLSVNLDSLTVLRAIAEAADPNSYNALQLAVRRMDLAAARAWQASLSKQKENLRLAIIAAGAIGDPDRVPWLIEQMNLPPMARVAGEAFTMITGIDLAYNHLEKRAPEGFEAGPTENPEDENVEMDPDENLPWPDPVLVQKWWSNNQSQFQKGTRYLLGKPITIEWLQQVLRIGRQRQRAAAALELAIRQPGQPLFEVRAPGFRQQALLGLGNR